MSSRVSAFERVITPRLAGLCPVEAPFLVTRLLRGFQSKRSPGILLSERPQFPCQARIRNPGHIWRILYTPERTARNFNLSAEMHLDGGGCALEEGWKMHGSIHNSATIVLQAVAVAE